MDVPIWHQAPYAHDLNLDGVGKDAKSPTRNKSKKMAPIDNVRDAASCLVERQKKCGNCGVAGHTKAQCAETERERPKKESKKRSCVQCESLEYVKFIS